MKELLDTIKVIYKTDRQVIIWMLVLFFLSAWLIALPLFNMRPSDPSASVGYADIGGYREGKWYDILAFSGMGLILGVLHNMLVLRFYKKRGGSAAVLFAALSIALVLIAIMTLMNIVGKA